MILRSSSGEAPRLPLLRLPHRIRVPILTPNSDGSVNPPTTGATGTIPSDRTSLGILGSVNTERLHNLGEGLSRTGSDIWSAIKSVPISSVGTDAARDIYQNVREAIPALHAYENARAQGKGIVESVSAANDEMGRQQAARDVLKQRIDEFKKNPQIATIHAIGDAAGLAAATYGGARLGLGAPEAGTTFDTETGNLVAPTTEAAAAPKVAGVTHVYNAATGEVEAVPKPGIVGTVKNVAKQVIQGKKVAQPGAQSAVREGVQSSVETTNAAAAKEPLAPTPTDKFPVSVEHDADGQVINADGRHRVVEAWERGDQTIPVVTKLADGATEIINQPPQAVAAKMGLGDTVEEAKDALANTDANQPYRAGNGKPRTPVYETPTPKTSSDVTPVKTVKLPEATEPLTENSKTTIVDDHLDALEQQKSSAYKRMDDTAGFDVKALKDKLKTDKYNLKQLGSSDPDKTGRLVEAIKDSTDRIAEANEKMKAAGIDPDYADALNKRWEAGQDYKASLLKRTNPDGSMNVKGLWDDAKKMRNDPEYGDRLEQWFGSKDAADAYVKALEKAHAEGLQAMKRQAFVRQILWRVAGTTAAGAVGLGLYDATH